MMMADMETSYDSGDHRLRTTTSSMGICERFYIGISGEETAP